MKLPRLRSLHLAAGAAVHRTAHLQAYPNSPVHRLIGFAVGSPDRHRGTHHEPVAVGPFRPAVLLWRTAPAPTAISQCILAWR
jgi:hypothetical protein